MARTRAFIRTTLTYSRKWRAIKNNDRARLLYLQFHHTPVCNSVGCYNITVTHLAADLCWGEQQVQEAIDRLSEVDLIDWNADEELVRIVDFVKQDAPTNEKHAFAMASVVQSLPDCPQKLKVFKELSETTYGAKVDAIKASIDRLSIAYPELPEKCVVTRTLTLTRTLTQPLTRTQTRTRPKPDIISAEPPKADSTLVASEIPTPAVVVATEKPFIVLPTNLFLKTGETVSVSQAEVDEYANTYPAVDVPQELKEMRMWLTKNVAKRKTKRGMAAFVNAWLARRQDRGGGLGLRTNGVGPAHGQARTETSVNAARTVLEEIHGNKPH